MQKKTISSCVNVDTSTQTTNLLENTDQQGISFISRGDESFIQGSQDINTSLLDILHRLLTEPVVMSAFRQHRQQILCIWQAVKDLLLYSNIACNVKLKIMKLAQITVQIFAEDKAMVDIAISVLHNGLCFSHVMSQNVGDIFLRNLVDFCHHNKTKSRGKAMEILIFHLHRCSGIMYRPVVIPVLKDILLSSNIDEIIHVTFNNFRLYNVWLNPKNTDVVQWYAAYAICKLIKTEQNEIHSFILHSVDINHLLHALNKSKLKHRMNIVFELITRTKQLEES